MGTIQWVKATPCCLDREVDSGQVSPGMHGGIRSSRNHIWKHAAALSSKAAGYNVALVSKEKRKKKHLKEGEGHRKDRERRRQREVGKVLSFL